MADEVPGAPAGLRTVTPYLTVPDTQAAIAFYRVAFGAEVLANVQGADGVTTHAEIRIGDCVLQFHDEMRMTRGRAPRTLGGTSVTFTLYTDDLDGWLRRAVEAGATLDSPPTEAFWGDRYARITDPAGHGWTLATHLQDRSEDEQRRAAAAFFADHDPHP